MAVDVDVVVVVVVVGLGEWRVGKKECYDDHNHILGRKGREWGEREISDVHLPP